VAIGQPLETIEEAGNKGPGTCDMIVPPSSAYLTYSPLFRYVTTQCAVVSIIYGPSCEHGNEHWGVHKKEEEELLKWLSD
jgi:hypothetical protein